MVVLNKIYTRGGDGGKTSLGDGSRVAKHHLRVDCYGTVDEANAAIGLARLHASSLTDNGEADSMLARIQNELFDLGADLCRPTSGTAPSSSAADDGCLCIKAAQIDRLENEIDRMNEDLAPLNSFVLPGGSPISSHLHLARTIVRRAERLATALSERDNIRDTAIRYLNRLSDHLFVLSRKTNNNGSGDVLWQPGATSPAAASGDD